MWPAQGWGARGVPLLLDKEWGLSGRKEFMYFQSLSVSTSDQFCWGGFGTIVSFFYQIHTLTHLNSAAECQVFSRFVSSPACHEISAGQLLAKFKVQHANIVRWYIYKAQHNKVMSFPPASFRELNPFSDYKHLILSNQQHSFKSTTKCHFNSKKKKFFLQIFFLGISVNFMTPVESCLINISYKLNI